MQLYLNGQLVASRATSGPMVANSVPLTIGLSDPGLNYGFQGLIDEPSIYGRALSQAEIQTIVNSGSKGKVPPVAVANVAPTPALSGFTTGLATQVLTYTASATDPSTLDQAAGFAYSINWGDGTPIQTVAATAGNGSGVSLSHPFTKAGTFTVTLSATDKDNGRGSISSTVTVLAVTSANLQTVINQQGSFTFQATTDAQAQSVTTALNGLSAQATPTTLTLNLGSGSYNDTTTHPPAGTTLVINGSGGTTTIVGHSPAFVVTSGNVILSNITLVTATDAPTLQVSGGNLTLRNVVIEESTTANQAALWITGGTVDLGTAASPGGNVFDTHGRGELIHNAGSAAVSAIGNTFQADGVAITSPYGIKDEIFDALNLHGGGLVTYVANNVYVTPASGSIQRGVDAVAAGGTVNVESGWYQKLRRRQQTAHHRLPERPGTHTADQLAGPQLANLVVQGTPGQRHDSFNPGGGKGSTVKVTVNDVAAGTFAPTGRMSLTAWAATIDIQEAGGLSLPALLYGEDRQRSAERRRRQQRVAWRRRQRPARRIGGGRDLLIGGEGRDLLRAVGDDLLIPGTTAFDANDMALAAITAEWTSGRSYNDRVANLTRHRQRPAGQRQLFPEGQRPGRDRVRR